MNEYSTYFVFLTQIVEFYATNKKPKLVKTLCYRIKRLLHKEYRLPFCHPESRTKKFGIQEKMTIKEKLFYFFLTNTLNTKTIYIFVMLTIFSKAGWLAIIFAGIFYVRITDITARNPVWSVNAPTALEVVSNRTCGLFFFSLSSASLQLVLPIRISGTSHRP